MIINLIIIFDLVYHNKSYKYLNLGELILFIKQLRISNYKFGFIAGKIFEDLDKNQIHYWVYSPGENAKIWNECYQNGYMAIEWKKLGDLRKFENKEDLNLKVKELYNKDGSAKNDTLTLWSLGNKIKNGDIVYAKQGTRKILGRGVVTSDYENVRINKYINRTLYVKSHYD